MQLDQTMGIDLPLKVLVWQDQAASRGCPTTIRAGFAKRHGLSKEAEPTVSALTGALRAIAKAATGAQ
jgi:uncharacterized protein (DUF302 family)